MEMTPSTSTRLGSEPLEESLRRLFSGKGDEVLSLLVSVLLGEKAEQSYEGGEFFDHGIVFYYY